MRRLQVPIARGALVLWGAAVLVLGAGATALHEATLPAPTVERGAPSGHFRMLHALAAECPCSGRVMDYLERRGAVADAEEVVLLVGADDVRASRLRARGFTVVAVDEQQLEREYEIRSAPSLVVLGPDGTVFYQGAYAPRPQMDPVDTELLAQARRGVGTSSMPILGCAVSRAIQARLDPLGIKYRR